MKNTKLNFPIFIIATLFITSLFAACSDNSDDEKYLSHAPTFTDIQVTTEDGNMIEAGKKATLTAVQSKKGVLLYKAKYDWTFEPDNSEVEQDYTKEVVYDVKNEDPTNEVIFRNKGKYKVRFTGRFYISGQHKIYNHTEIKNGCTITYSTPGIQYYEVTITKSIDVRQGR